MSSCCPKPDTAPHSHDDAGIDLLFWGSLMVIAAGVAGYTVSAAFGLDLPVVHHFGHSVLDLIKTMWWGVLLGLVVVGLMGQVPKDYFTALLGRGDRPSGIFRAAAAGLLLDLCSHGI